MKNVIPRKRKIKIIFRDFAPYFLAEVPFKIIPVELGKKDLEHQFYKIYFVFTLKKYTKMNFEIKNLIKSILQPIKKIIA